MKLKLQKKLAADVLNCSVKRVALDVDRLEEIKEAITKADIKSLAKDKAIIRKPVKGVSRVRARKRIVQRRKGRQKGHGTRKGKKTSIVSRKTVWINKIRAQRKLLNELKDNGDVTKSVYRLLYLKAKGGFFRSRRHISLYIEEHKLTTK
ncbi:MAG: 50S ribosomal protein L19e [Candidatus Woesearchaeota archaeon]|jgi:large subunit ribosomal protein L19e|nr:50S ribosomal protein L19e [Candidatus Woesearchaeota archaeon]